MRAVGLCARSLLRRKAWGTAAVVLLIGVAGGAVFAALAGARRTDTAYARLLRATDAADVRVGPQGFGTIPAAQIAQLPGVARVGSLVGFGMSTRPKGGGLPSDFGGEVFAAATPDGVELHQLDRLHMLDGRLPRPGRVGEAVVNEIFLRRMHLGLGDTYRAYVFSFQQLEAKSSELEADGRTEPTPQEIAEVFTPVDLTVVGVGRPRGDLLINENQDQSGIFLTPAFARKFANKVSYAGAAVQLRHGARDVASFEAAARKQFPDQNLDFQVAVTDAATFAQVAKPYVDALRLFALVAAITGLLVIAQALLRMVAADAADGGVLSAIGATRSQRAVASAARAATAVVVGSVAAVLAAYLASSLFPIGRSRLAEPAPGLLVDEVALGLGFASTVVLLLAVTGAAAWWMSRARGATVEGGERHPSRVVEGFVRSGAPVAMATGLRFALQRDRHAADQGLIAALFGLVAAIAAVGATLVFATNLDELVTHPVRYGWAWDGIMDTYDAGASPDFVARLRADHDIAALTTGARASIVLDGRTVAAFGFAPVRGRVLPAVTDGRWPRSASEIALGAHTLHDLGKTVGDTVRAHAPEGRPVTLRVVGITSLPSLALNGTYGVGEGAALTASGLRALDAAASPSFLLMNVALGVRLTTLNHRYSDIASTLGPQRPADIQSYANVRSTPLALSALLAVLGIGVLAHLLVTSVRARRRDLAVLKTLGLARRQVRAAVVWQATTLVVLALAVGVPLGLVAGRWTWKGFADSLGLDPNAAVPFAAIALLVLGAIVIGNIVAALPSRTAARTRPAAVLRSE